MSNGRKGAPKSRLIRCRRRDGRVRTTVTVRYHLAGEDIAMILARLADAGGIGDFRPDVWVKPYTSGVDMTASQVAHVVHRWIWIEGSQAHLSEDGFDGSLDADQASAIADWAYRQVQRLFPEMVDETLTAWRDGYRTYAAEEAARQARWKAEAWPDDRPLEGHANNGEEVDD